MKPVILFIVLVFAFICGDNVLTAIGYPHHDFTTSAFFRLHPLTYLSIFLLIYYFIIGRLKVSDLTYRMKNEVLFLIVCFIVVCYLDFTNNLNAISFLLDALCLPAILSILLKLTDRKTLYRFRVWIYIFFFINAIISIIEKVRGAPLIGIETYGFNYFRSTALFGHPLNNALIMSILTIILFYNTKNNWIKTIVLSFGMLAIFSFGARGGLIGVFLGIALNILFSAIGFGVEKTTKSKINNGLKYLAIFGIILFIIISYTQLGDRIVALSHIDSSAEARVESYDVLHGLSFKDLLWGYGIERIAYFKYASGVDIIENFWIVWLLRFGLIITIFLAIFLFLFLYKMMKSIPKGIRLIFLFVLFFVASTNNSLSTNTLVLSIFVLAIYILPQKKETSDNIILDKEHLICESVT